MIVRSTSARCRVSRSPNYDCHINSVERRTTKFGRNVKMELEKEHQTPSVDRNGWRGDWSAVCGLNLHCATMADACSPFISLRSCSLLQIMFLTICVTLFVARADASRQTPLKPNNSQPFTFRERQLSDATLFSTTRSAAVVKSSLIRISLLLTTPTSRTISRLEVLLFQP